MNIKKQTLTNDKLEMKFFGGADSNQEKIVRFQPILEALSDPEPMEVDQEPVDDSIPRTFRQRTEVQSDPGPMEVDEEPPVDDSIPKTFQQRTEEQPDPEPMEVD
jgi:hypothetical protein